MLTTAIDRRTFSGDSSSCSRTQLEVLAAARCDAWDAVLTNKVCHPLVCFDLRSPAASSFTVAAHRRGPDGNGKRVWAHRAT